MSARWSQDLQALATRTGLRMDTVIRKATFDLFRSVALKSPVDTGRFRANWNVTYGAPDLTTTESNNQARAVQQAQQALTLPVGGVVSMSNGLPYARRLEYGYSRQAPYGMVRYSVLEYRRFLLRAIS
jgi:hypothetical protein